jgi:outer membrane protein assembly factor BamB
MRRALLAVAMASVALGGCNWIKNLGKKDNVEPPTPLVEFAPSASVETLWTASIGKGSGKSGARMHPAVVGDRLYVASVDGEVRAIDAGSGRTLWSIDEKSREWSGGPAASEEMVVVGDLSGHVQAYSAADGSALWQTRLNSEVICAPQIAPGVIAVRSQDGRLFGLDPSTGTQQWVYEQAVPVLSLRGNSSPLVGSGFVFGGYDSGRVVAVRESDGAPAWSQVLSAGEGRTEVERLADSDGAAALVDGVLYVTSYNGQLAAFQAESGRPLWARALSSYAGLAVGESAVVVNDAEGNVWAFDRQSGANLWKQEALLHRWLSPPAIVGSHAVMGDIEGYVHWLSLSDGSFTARERLGKKPIESAPVVNGDTVYVEDASGRIGAYRTQ